MILDVPPRIEVFEYARDRPGSPKRVIVASLVVLVKESVADFQRHRDVWLAAAISYFAIFAVAPLIIVVVAIAGFLFGQRQAVLAEIYAYLQTNAGKAAAESVSRIVSTAYSHPRESAIAQALGWLVFIIAAIGLFNALQEALNVVWEIEPKGRGLAGTIRGRFLAFGLVLTIAFLLLVALGANTILAALAKNLISISPLAPMFVLILDFLLSYIAITGLIGLMYRFLPECHVKWREVWPGAAVTSFLFVAGQSLLGWYLGRASIVSAYGAFGALVAFMMWVNYSVQIVLLGAEFTHAHARAVQGIGRQ
jgi:membrane protein